MAVSLILAAIVVAALSGVAGVVVRRGSAWGPRVAATAMVVAALVGLTGAALALLAPVAGPDLHLPWPAAGGMVVGIDALSAFFLVPVFLMGGLGAVYGLGAWPARRHPGNAGRLSLFWGVLVAGMGLVLVSRHGLTFLLGWEAMAIAAFFLIAAEDYRDECRRAAWVYLNATHVGTLTLFAFFTLWRWATGSWAFAPVAADASLVLVNALFLLALVAFGLKAGMMPLHFWLPGAHAAAPSHVSAMLSGVVLKMGIYGLLRFLSLLPDPPLVWGFVVLGLGAVSSLLGVAFALAQHDLKRLLAYHSVENIGIILMALGVALVGRSTGHPVWQALGLGACLLHVWNHSLFKALLFLGAGAVVHAAHSRQLDRLGGLARTMPWTAALFLVGAVAICGLPPLNGFVSELLLYLGLFATLVDDGVAGFVASLAAPVLAMTGGLAVACFVKVYGVVFLGTPRTRAAAATHEPPVTVLAPMVVLAAACAAIGVAPILVAPLLDATVAAWGPTTAGAVTPPLLATVAPLGALTAAAVTVAAVVVAVVAWAVAGGRRAARTVTWDCGYAAPTARMQYTASSFARTLVVLFAWVLRPHEVGPRVSGLFAAPAELSSHVADPVLDRLLVPAGRAVEGAFAWFHRFQRGLAQSYVLYLLITVLVLLATLVPVHQVVARVFAR